MEKIQEAHQLFKLKVKTTTVLVLGGSLGARKINQLIEKNISFFKKHNIQLLWQCGKLYFEEYQKYQSKDVQVMAFIERMDLVYAAADIVISRAGASSVSELCIVGKPVVFIPSPNVAEDHQTKNANACVKQGAAVLLADADAVGKFKEYIDELLQQADQAMYQAKRAGRDRVTLAGAEIEAEAGS